MAEFLDGSADITTMEKSAVSKLLFSQINWQEILRAGVVLSHKDHQLLEKAQDNLSNVMENRNDARTLCKLLMKIADNCTSNVTVQQYVFTRVQEIVDADGNHNQRVEYFTDGGFLQDASFLRALRASDAYTRQSACIGLACLLSCSEGNDSAFCLWICEQLSNTAATDLDHVLTALTILIRKAGARQIFMGCGGVRLVSSTLSRLGPNGNAQHLYDLSFALWTFTLSAATSDRTSAQNNVEVQFDHATFLASGTIPILSELIAAAPSRKVIRMAISTLRNLAMLQQADVLTEMLNVGIDRQMEVFINNGSHKQAGDVELENDSKQLQDVLLRNYRDLSTFEKWVSEIQSGALRWGIVHTEKFWRENNKLMEHNDFAYVKTIIGFLKSDNPQTIAIALYDLGEFTRFYSNGRTVTKSLGGKDLAMTFIEHDNAEIQRQALQCISKVMISNWDHLR